MDPLQQLLDEARRDQAVEARAHEHWLRRAAHEGATFTGALVDLAESGQSVSVRIASGHVHHGHVVAVGTDFCAVEAGEISVTPLHFDLTDIEGMDALERWRVDALLAPEAASPSGS